MEAFGTVKSDSQNGVHLTTKDWDSDSDLYYFNERWLDPATGNFLQTAPYEVDEEQTYAFLNQDPINYHDPDGRLPAAAGPIIWTGCRLGALYAPQIGRCAKAGIATAGAGAKNLCQKLEPKKSKKKNKDDDYCRDQWTVDTAWCNQHHLSHYNVACHARALDNLLRCRKGEPRLSRMPYMKQLD